MRTLRANTCQLPYWRRHTRSPKGMAEWLSMFFKAFDKVWNKLPIWAKVIWVVLTIAGSAYMIAQDGFGYFILRVIFSP